MKKIFLALVALALFTGCDDGDMTFKTFDFSEGRAPEFCRGDRGTIFKINGSEVLLLNLDPDLLLRVPTAVPTRVNVGSSGPNRMFYRTYSGTPNAETFCESSGTPNLVDEWSGNGTVLITTTANIDQATGAVSGYTYSFTIESATFSNGEQEVTILDSPLRGFTEPNNFAFNFSGTGGQTARCSNRPIAYKTKVDESLELRLENNTYFSTPGNKTIDLANEEDDNNLYFVKFNTSVTTTDICEDDRTGTVQLQLWRAISGRVEITQKTDSEDPTIMHYDVRLFEVVFANNDDPRELYRPANTAGEDFYYMGEF
jgi:hypothetical protein